MFFSASGYLLGSQTKLRNTHEDFGENQKENEVTRKVQEM